MFLLFLANFNSQTTQASFPHPPGNNEEPTDSQISFPAQPKAKEEHLANSKCPQVFLKKYLTLQNFPICQ